jgi:hypothetical protein
VFIDGGKPIASTVVLSTAVFIDNLTVDSGDTLDVSGGDVTFSLADPGAGTVANSGTITLDTGGSIALNGGGLPAPPPASLTGSGTVMMSAGTYIFGKTDLETLKSTNTIMGAGTISDLSLINNGTINASVPGGPTLAISPSTAPTSTGVANFSTGAPGSGILEATGGGTLELGFGTFDNSATAPGTMPGTIAALGGTVMLGSSGKTTIIGGTLTTTGPGSVIVNAGTATLKGVAISAGSSFAQGDFATTNLEGTITNDGVISLSSSGHSISALNLDSGDVTLSGTGTVNLLGFAAPPADPDPNLVRILGTLGARLTIGPSQTIMGSGQIGTHSTALSPKLTNHGTITATTYPPGGPIPQGITIFPLAAPAGMPPITDALINDGTIVASDNSFLTFNGGVVTNSGPGGPGTISAISMGLPSTVTLQGGVTVNGGKITLDGFASLLQLNNATARPDTLMNPAGGTITTVAPSTANILGGTITNSLPGSIVVADNSALTLDNATMGGSVTNSGIIQVGTGMAPGPAALTINQGSLANFDMTAPGVIMVESNGVLNLVGTGGVGGNAIINGGSVGIDAGPGTIKLNNATIHDGTLSIPAGGLVTTVKDAMNNYLGGTVNNDGMIQVAANSQLFLEAGPGNTYMNAGTITLSGAALNPASLRPSGFGGTVSLVGGGTVNLAGDAVDNFIFGDKGNEQLINVDNKIIGGGTIGASNLSLTNKFGGMISATMGAGITINPNAAGVINGGTIQTDGATLNLMTGTFTNVDGANLGTIAVNPGDQLNLTGGVGRPAIINGGTVNVNSGPGGAGTMNLSMGTIHGGTLNNLMGGTINSLAGPVNTLGGTVNNNAGATIDVNAGATLDLESTGTYNNDGLISINAAAGSSLRINGANGTATLNGSGTVTLQGAGSSIVGVNGSETLVNQTNTINGGGAVGAGTLAITNRNLISATNAAVPLTILPNAGGVINSSTLQANGGTLTFGGGTISNFEGATKGTIQTVNNGDIINVTGNAVVNGGIVGIAPAGGMINLNNGTIHGGTLNIPADGLVTTVNGSTNNYLGGTVNNFFNGKIQVVANSQLFLEAGGTYNNVGSILLTGAADNAASLRPSGFGGTVSLAGGGFVNLAGDFTNNFIFGDKGNERLIDVNNTIIGGGTIGAGNLSLTNQVDGVISATKGAGITINPNADGVINGGMIKTGGATLNLMMGTFTNFDGANLGTITADFGDQLNLTGGVGRPAIINGGTVNVNKGALAGGTLNVSMGTIHGGTLNNLGANNFVGGTINALVGPVNTLGGTVNNNVGATINVNAGATLDLETTGTYKNDGLISVNAGAGSSLRINGANGTATLNGVGTVTLQGAGSSILGANGSETLLNQTNTINGGGALGAGTLAIINRNFINATNAVVDLTIQPNAGGLTNSNTIQTGPGDLVLMGGDFTNFEGATDGLIQANNGDSITINNNAIIDGGNVNVVGGGTINLSNATIHNGTLTNNANGVILSTTNTTNTVGGTVNNLAGGLISVAPSSILKLVTGGTYNNAGLLRIGGAGAMQPGNLMLDGAGGTVTLSGGGTVTMSQAGGNSISGVFGNERLINLDNTINGVGQIGLGMMSLTNDGTIDANMTGPNITDGLGITISPNAGGVINGGILQASNGATLTLNGGIYTNTTGIIQSLGVNSEVELKSGATINGGSFGSSPQALIRVVDEAVLNTVTNNANLAQNEGSILDLIGTITNNGTIVMPANNFVTQIKLLNGNVTLGGTGSLVLQNSGLNQILAANGLDRLTIGASQTVRGTGNIGVGMLALTNNGTIIADQPTPLTIQPNAGGFINAGTLQAAAGSTLNVIGGYTQATGNTNVLGTLNVTGGFAQAAGNTNVVGTLNVTSGPLTAGGGMLSGSGMSNISGGFNLTGSFTKSGSGTATISGPQSFASGTSLNLNGGTVQFDVTSGAVSVGSGVTATVASGATLDLAGSVSALSSGTMRVNITNNSTAPGVLVSGTNQQVGAISGSGSVTVNAGSDLKANCIIQSALVINGGAGNPGLVTIVASNASGNSLVQVADGSSFLSAAAPTDAATAFMNSGSAFNDVMAPTEQLAGGPRVVPSVQQADLPLGGASAFSPPIVVVPEPQTVILFAIGALMGLFLLPRMQLLRTRRTR